MTGFNLRLQCGSHGHDAGTGAERRREKQVEKTKKNQKKQQKNKSTNQKSRRTRSRHGCATYAWKASCAAESTHCKAHRGKSGALRQAMRSALESWCMQRVSGGRLETLSVSSAHAAPPKADNRMCPQQRSWPGEPNFWAADAGASSWTKRPTRPTRIPSGQPTHSRGGREPSRRTTHRGALTVRWRSLALAHLGERSAARTALEAAPLAPSTDETMAALRDPTKRPQTWQVPLPDWLSNFQPEGGCTPQQVLRQLARRQAWGCCRAFGVHR